MCVCVFVLGRGCFPPLPQQWWICHLSSCLLHSPAVTAPTDGNYEPCPLSSTWDLSILLGYSARVCGCCHFTADTCIDDLWKKWESDEYLCVLSKLGISPIYCLTLLHYLCEIITVKSGRILLNSVKSKELIKSCVHLKVSRDFQI